MPSLHPGRIWSSKHESLTFTNNGDVIGKGTVLEDDVDGLRAQLDVGCTSRAVPHQDLGRPQLVHVLDLVDPIVASQVSEGQPRVTPLDGHDGVHHEGEADEVELPDGDDAEGEGERQGVLGDLGRREGRGVAFGHVDDVAVEFIALVGAVDDQVAAAGLPDAAAGAAGVLVAATGRHQEFYLKGNI